MQPPQDHCLEKYHDVESSKCVCTHASHIYRACPCHTIQLRVDIVGGQSHDCAQVSKMIHVAVEYDEKRSGSRWRWILTRASRAREQSNSDSKRVISAEPAP